VPVHDGARTLAACLEAIFASQAIAPLEVIVVDDGSTDGSTEIAARFPGRVLRQPARRGPAAARNRGAEAAAAARILFVDADVLVRPGTLAALAATLDIAPAAFATYDPEPREPGFATALYHALSVRSLRDTSARTPVFYSYCAAIRREDFQALGGFDETFTRATFEDMELGVRLARRGELAVHRRDLEVIHAVRYDLRGLARAYFRKSRDLAELLLSRGAVTFSDQGWTRRRNWLELAGAWGTVGFLPLALLASPLAAVAWLAAAAAFLAGALPVARTLGRRRPTWGLLAIPGLLAVHFIVTAAMAAAIGSWAAGRLSPPPHQPQDSANPPA
jgi:glycosyltransferase involved in cell wall biosynthesis